MTEEEEAVRLVCVICNNDIAATDEFVKVGNKGIRTLVNACEVKNYDKLGTFFNSHRNSSSKIPLHVICRKRLVDLRNQVIDRHIRLENTLFRVWYDR